MDARYYQHNGSRRSQMYRDDGYGRDTHGDGNLTPIIGAMAAGFVVGMVAHMGRKIAMEAMTDMTGNWVEALKSEHRQVEKIFEHLLETSESDGMKRAMLHAKLAAALTKHDLKESTIVYPALRMHARKEDSKKLAEDHAEIKTRLYELEQEPKTEIGWIDKVRALQDLVAEHVREEEEVIFPTFQDLLSEDQNRSIGLKVHRQGLLMG